MLVQQRLYIRRDLRIAGAFTGFTFRVGRASRKSARQDKDEGQCVMRFEFAHLGLLRIRWVVHSCGVGSLAASAEDSRQGRMSNQFHGMLLSLQSRICPARTKLGLSDLDHKYIVSILALSF